MATYKNNGGELVFPFLTDADGNVLVVEAGSTFTAPDGLLVDSVSVVTTKTKTTDNTDNEEQA